LIAARRHIVFAVAVVLAIVLMAFLLVRCSRGRPSPRGPRVVLCQERPTIGLAAAAGAGGGAGVPSLPTNQWWSSLLTSAPQTLWAQPLVVSWAEGGVELALPIVNAVPKAIVSGRTSPLTIVTKGARPSVSSYGDFHVVTSLAAGARRFGDLTVAQGSPAVWWKTNQPLEVQFPDGARVVGAIGSTDRVTVEIPDGSAWMIVSNTEAQWRVDGNIIVALGASTFGFVARPNDASPGWAALAVKAGKHRVTGTSASWERRPGEVMQTLTWSGGVGSAVLLPHQAEGAKSVGWFASARGRMPVVATDVVSWAAPLPGVLLGVPELSEPASRRVRDLLPGDDRTKPVPAGSYFAAKTIGTMATLTDLATRVGATDVARRNDQLAAELTNALMRTGDGDDRWVAYDDTRGGMISYPPEFGSQDYNDHNLQNGYLLAAAATLAEAGHPALGALRPTIDHLIADLGAGGCRKGFPPFRVMNAYEGHSYAAGFAPFADGNNQESSSEAVHAWWALTRWAAATNQPALYNEALAFYATEAATARWYWLGEKAAREPGYGYQVAGIVWGAKIDFATFFDARPASVVGIQLLPFTFGSLYRNDGAAAAKRFVEGSTDSAGRWADLLALDLAIADPAKAAAVLDSTKEWEEGSTRSFAAAWVDFLAAAGRPDPTVTAEPPLGLAFRGGSGDRITLTAVNPWPTRQTVVFERGGRKLATITLEPHASSTATVGTAG
jgi:endo-1,3(4)-beta-glucanase